MDTTVDWVMTKALRLLDSDYDNVYCYYDYPPYSIPFDFFHNLQSLHVAQVIKMRIDTFAP